MEYPTRVSIIINNYNYGRYLRQAIESALHQTYPHCECIVVDDGSTDDSHAVIESYAGKVIVILKANGGQGSAFNAGFKASSGDVIIYLDADDLLSPDTVETVMQHWGDGGVAKMHWPLTVINADGVRTDEITPKDPLPQGQLLDQVVAKGPNAYLSSPTSGNAWSRKYLEQVMPMPEPSYAICADNYLCMLAPLYGAVQALDKPTGSYRIHGGNNWRGKFLEEHWLQAKIDRYACSCDVLKKYLAAQEIHAPVDSWYSNSWLVQLQESIRDIRAHVPEFTSFILADGDEWQVGDTIANRQVIPFMERDNRYWGMPANDDDAIREIERHSEAGYIFFASPVFWFKDHYRKLFDYLSKQHQCVIDNSRLLGYKLVKQQ